MDCKESELLLHAYIDGELDLGPALELEKHLKNCRSCARALKNHKALKSVLASANPSYKAPDSLRRQVLGSIRQEARAPILRSPAWRPMQIAASFAAVLLVLATGTMRWRAGREDDRLTQEIVSNHVRSLMTGHVTDVASTNQHTVKPWFAGKLDYSPPVQDLAADGFPLVGGRLDNIDGRTVAALAYKRREHTINLFIWPAAPRTPSTDPERTVRGFHSLRWLSGGMVFWAVSDLNAQELSQFARLLRE